MPPTVPPSSMPMSVLPPSAEALRAQAGELEQAASRGLPRQPLLGMCMGLVCGDESAAAAAQFKAAALGLGAQVTVLDPARVLDEGAALEEIARMLGRLYGAVACHALPAAVVRRLERAAEVPVLDVQAVIGAAGGEPEPRRWAAQAALLAALR